jgi:hypothetical protein
MRFFSLSRYVSNWLIRRRSFGISEDSAILGAGRISENASFGRVQMRLAEWILQSLDRVNLGQAGTDPAMVRNGADT